MTAGVRGNELVRDNLEYWLENLEKKFVYNHSRELFGLNKEETDAKIKELGLEHVRLVPEEND